MNVFTYLKADEKHLQELLWDLTNNYPDWTMDHVFEQVKNAIDSIHAHTKKKEDLLINIVHSNKKSMGDVVDKYRSQTEDINEVINSLVMIHVDEPGFEQLLIRLSHMVDNLIRFSRDELYPAVRQVATEDEVKQMNKHLDHMVLS